MVTVADSEIIKVAAFAEVEIFSATENVAEFVNEGRLYRIRTMPEPPAPVGPPSQQPVPPPPPAA